MSQERMTPPLKGSAKSWDQRTTEIFLNFDLSRQKQAFKLLSEGLVLTAGFKKHIAGHTKKTIRFSNQSFECYIRISPAVTLDVTALSSLTVALPKAVAVPPISCSIGTWNSH